MNFHLTEEQRMLQDSVRRFVEKRYARSAESPGEGEGGAGDGLGHWPSFAENGWLAAALPEEYGGLGGSIVDTTLICTELGRGLATEPFMGCGVLAAQTIVAGGSPEQRQRLLPALAEGSRRVALAYGESTSFGDPELVQAQAKLTEGGYVLRGRKTLVLGARGADEFIVSAALQEAPGVSAGIALFLVDARSEGLVLHSLPLLDGSQSAELELNGVVVGPEALLGDPVAAIPALRHGLAHAVAALGAELVGAMEKSIEITAEYLKVRKQFGVNIGTFQVLQHRMADMAAECEMARSMLYALLSAIEADDADARDRAAWQAKALIGRSAKFVCGQGIQLHGGMGMTEECGVGAFYKRAVVADVLFGSSDRQDARCAAALRQELLEAESQA